MRPLTLQRLQVFCAVYEHESITTAARSMKLSQPTVSRHLRDFEAALGLTLFVLDRGRVIPTAEADSIYNESRFLYDGLNRLENRIEAVRKGTGTRLSVMTVGLLAQHFVTGAISRIKSDMPNLHISVDVGTLGQQLQAMKNGQAEIGIVAGRIHAEDVQLSHLGRGRLVVLVPEEMEIAAKDQLSLDDLRNVPLLATTTRGPIGRVLSDEMVERGMTVDPSIAVNSLILIPLLASQTRMAAIVDEFTAYFSTPPGFVVKPLAPKVSFDIYAITSGPVGNKLAAQNFVAYMRKYLADWARGDRPLLRQTSA
ncbi:LysR family transcriptional regulator [Celeribacter sp. PS-C1]|uniref:LysR family transcriptional regulator n=1 Tax=Celeribacter sp. PS-C1 TaxID=2820813 RepID=UPI001C6807AD|nr:LysR family transcriptional regulator [Celeribacter sp. PS-C1]MBW6417420.1 LysR family transcriptional regulator [Celeribacter sp. PS-C1]